MHRLKWISAKKRVRFAIQQPKFETKVEKTPVAETVAVCSKTDDFNGKAQYKVTHRSPNKLVAQVYNLSGLAFMKDIEIKNFSEEMNVVPELGLISSSDLHIADASYTQTDKTTGLKSELGNLKDLRVTQNIQKDNDIIRYKTNMLMDNLKIALPIFSMQIKSDQQAADLEYKVPEGAAFDYAEIWRNFEYLVLSKSKATIKDINIAIGFFDFGMTFDLDTKNYAKANDAGTMDSTGNMLISNVAFSGSMVEPSKQFRSIAVKYDVNGINMKSFAILNKMKQDQLNNETQPDQEELARVLDEILQTAVLDTDLEVKFANASVAAKFNVQKKNGYMFGNGKVNIKNLYNIFPEMKQCLNNPEAQNIPDCADGSMFAELKEVIDMSKDDSVIDFKYDEQGIFRNGEKIGEPIELNFQKMLQEQKLKEQQIKEEQEKMQQMMAEQSQPAETLTTDQ